MKRKSVIALILAFALLLCTACSSVQVKDNPSTNTKNPSSSTKDPSGDEVTGEPITLRLVYANKNEKDANIVRDMLTKKGFVVEMNAQADNSGVKTQAEAGNYDIIVHASGNPAYSVDYALKYFIYPGGSLNWSNIDDDVLTKMIDDAGAAPMSQWDEVYSELEQYMVHDMVYSTPLYQEAQGAASSPAVDIKTYRTSVALPYLDYIDTSLRDTRTFKWGAVATSSQFPTMDPIRHTSGVTGTVANFCYAYLLRIDSNNGNTLSTRGTLSQAYSVAETNQEFYFLLRDDCYFTRIDKNGEPYVTDHLVAGEDVCYSLLRAANPDSIAGNAAYTYFSSIADCAIVTDMDELKNTKNADGVSVYDELNAGAANDLSALAATRDDVDGANGKYQVVKLTTKTPFSQVLNYLNQHSAGVLDSEWVESINSKVDMSKYDSEKDWLYGDTKNLYPDENYYNDCSFSGPYVVTTADDYGVKLVKNDGFAVNGDPNYDQGLIRNVEYVYMADTTASFTALRSGDIDLVPKLSNADIKLAKDDSSVNFNLMEGYGNHFIIYNRTENSVCSNLLVRKAISAAINQKDVIAGIGNAVASNSVISVGFKTSNTFDYDDTATEKYLKEYWASIS